MSLDARAARTIEQEALAMVRADPQAALTRAHQRFQSSHQHKKLAQHHRRRAAADMEAFNAFKRNLEALGIRVIIEESLRSPSPRRPSDPTNKSTA